MENQRDAATLSQYPQQDRAPLTSRQYEKLADWGERVALVALGSLVVQQIVVGKPITSGSVLTGMFVTTLAYGAAYRWLKQAQ